jgi:hypothetical protein
VILVPGIFASHLTDPIPAGRSVAWPVNETPGMLRLAGKSPLTKREEFGRGDFFEANPRTNKPPDGIPRERGWQTVFLKKYQPFLARCHAPQSGELPFVPLVYAVGYNFASSNEVSAAGTIRAAIREIFERHKSDADADSAFRFRFFLVTHSMGALVVRRALQLFSGLRAGCLGVIHVAAPNAGAPEALMRFIRGMETSAGLVEGAVIKRIFGDEGWKVSTAASRIAAGFQLFPYPMLGAQVPVSLTTRRVFEAVNAPARSEDEARTDAFFLRQIITTNFSETRNVTLRSLGKPDRQLPRTTDGAWRAAVDEQQPIIDDVLFHTTEARRLHDELALPTGFFSRTATVSLTGVSTVQAVKLTFDANSRLTEAVEFTDNNGDGTVPLSSQQFRVPGRTTTLDGRQIDTARTVTGVSHENALTNAEVIRHVFDFMRQFWRPIQP